MTRQLLALVLVGLVASVAQAQDRTREVMTVSTTAVGFNLATIEPPNSVGQMFSCFAQVEDASIRYTVTGLTPTASVGIPVSTGVYISINGPTALRNFRAIRSGGSDATLQWECSRIEGESLLVGAATSVGVSLDAITDIEDGAGDSIGDDANDSIRITCASGCGGSGGSSAADDAAFTVASEDVNPVALLFDDTTPDSVDEGDRGIQRMSANRNAYTTIRDAGGNERGLNVDANGDIGVTIEGQTGNVTVTATNLDVQSGGADILSETAHDAAFGTAGSADAQVRTVQGVASMTPLLVDATGQGNVPVTAVDLDVRSGGVDPLGSSTFTSTWAAGVVVSQDATPWLVAIEDSSGDSAMNDTANALRVTGVDASGNAVTPAEEYTADVAAPTDPSGPTIMMERDDALGTLSEVAGRWNNLRSNDSGALWTAIDEIAGALPAGAANIGQTETLHDNDIRPITCNQTFIIDTTADAELVAISGSTVVYVCGYVFTADSSVGVRLTSGTGSVCGTGTTAETVVYELTADRPVAVYPQGSTRTASGAALCVDVDDAVQIRGEVHVAQF